MSRLEKCDCPERVERTSSVFSGADAQIGRADYVSINSPLTGVAEERTFMTTWLTI
jgi:hypothetical protein